MSYSTKVLDHYENPRNVGSFDKSDESVGTGMVGAPACGDVMKLQIKVNEAGVIEDARFKTYGCGSAIASSSLVTEWVKGKTLDEAMKIRNTQIAEELAPAAREGPLFHPGRRRDQGRGAELQRKAFGSGRSRGELNMSVTLTQQAATHIGRYLQKRGKGIGLRLGVRTTGCSGMAYKLGTWTTRRRKTWCSGELRREGLH